VPHLIECSDSDTSSEDGDVNQRAILAEYWEKDPLSKRLYHDDDNGDRVYHEPLD